eukprot:GHUV01040632.1.p1 GENE.GHUV01040632.1~~GHUV01040632.1.p1  ORF type:complete len:142 (-),score=38.47 GHUV01040632.1:137-562(-)
MLLLLVLLLLSQCLPRPDTAATMAAQQDSTSSDALMTDDSSSNPIGVGALGASDQLIPNPGPDAAAQLGTISDIQFFAGKMRDVCAGSDEIVTKVRSVLASAGAEGSTVGHGAAIGAEVFNESLESVDLLNRQLKAYLASL